MPKNNITSIKETTVFNSTISLEDSLKEDMKQGLLGDATAKSFSLSEQEDKVEYTIQVKQVDGKVAIVVPDDVKERHSRKTRIEDYLIANDKEAMELL